MLDLYVSDYILSCHPSGFMFHALESGFTDDFWASGFYISTSLIRINWGYVSMKEGSPTVPWVGKDLFLYKTQ